MPLEGQVGVVFNTSVVKHSVHESARCWSRRINREHRFAYRISRSGGEDQRYIILQARFHYNKG
ncbi:MAG: type II toxin-antitoxin system YoeB family toxin [Catalinimonas sp.]